MKSIRIKFFAYTIPLIVSISLCFLALFVYWSNQLIKQSATELGFALVRNLSYSSELAVASEDEIFIKPYLNKIFQERDVALVAVYNKNGRLIVSNKKIEIDETMPREILDELLIKKVALRKESQSQQGLKIYDFYSPIFISEILSFSPAAPAEDLAGFARVTLSLAKIAEQNKKVFAWGILISVGLVLLGLIGANFLAEKMTMPIKQLIRGVGVIAKGELGHRIKLKTGDELEELARAFNKMAENLNSSRAALDEERTSLEIRIKARTKELQEFNEQLEDKVEERTEELRRRVAELERFHRVTVGRELKMIELKKRIKELEQKGRR